MSMGYQINYSCEKCQTVINLDSDLIGTTLQCPNCGSTFEVKAPLQSFCECAPEQKKFNCGKTALILKIVSIVFGGLIVVAILIALWNARERAHRSNCMSNVHRLGQGVLLYAVRNEEHLPTVKGSEFFDIMLKDGCGSPSDSKCPSANSSPSYAYIGAGLIIGKDDARLPIIVEYPENHQDIANVAYLTEETPYSFSQLRTETISLPEHVKTLPDVVTHVLQKQGVVCTCSSNSYSKCGYCKVLDNAKQY